MVWILIGGILSGFLVAAPSIYDIFGRHMSWGTLATFWRLGPHQFFFTLFVVPFTTCLTGCALWWTVTAAKASHQGGLATTFAENWPIAFLWPLALAAFLAGVFFIGITWSPDKLRAPYLDTTAEAIRSVEARDSRGAPVTSADIAKAHSAAGDAVTRHSRDMPMYLHRLPSLVRLQVVMNGDVQRSLDLTDGAATGLSGFQVWITLAAGLMTLICVIVMLLLKPSARLPAVSHALGHARLAALLASLSLLLYAYLFSLYRQEITRVAGPNITSNQDLAATIGVAICLLLLFLSLTTKISADAIPTLSGLAVAIAEVAGASRLGIFRTLFGWDTKLATQLVLVVAIVILGSIGLYAVRPQT